MPLGVLGSPHHDAVPVYAGLGLVMSDSLWPHGLYTSSGFPVHGIFQARILEWVAIFYSRESFLPRDWTCVSWICRWIFYHWAMWEACVERDWTYQSQRDVTYIEWVYAQNSGSSSGRFFKVASLFIDPEGHGCLTLSPETWGWIKNKNSIHR